MEVWSWGRMGGIVKCHCVCLGPWREGWVCIYGMHLPCLCIKSRPLAVCCFLRRFIVDKRKRMDSCSLLQSPYGLQSRRWRMEIHKMILWVCNRSTGCTPAAWLSFCPCIITVDGEKNGLSSSCSATNTSKDTENLLWEDPWWRLALRWGNASYNFPGWCSGATGVSVLAKL